MNQRNILNLGLALALAGLVAVVAYQPGKELDEKTTLLTRLITKDVQKIVIEQIGQPSIMLAKIKNQWQMKEPYNNLANTLRINKFLALVSAKSHAQYSASSANLKQLKLLTPNLIATIDDVKLLFGTTDALKGYRYIQINNTVHLITDRYSYLVQGQATTLLNPALLPKNTTISKLVLPELTLELTKTGWQSQPPNKSASADQLQQLLDEWRFARALRVSKIPPNNQHRAAAIKVHTDNNQTHLFGLIQQKDEIILQNKNTGLSYHFATEAGERLLNFSSINNSPSDDK